MSDLGPEARALVEAGRKMDGPPPGAKARIAESLQARIEAGATVGAGASTGSAAWIGGAAALGVAAAAVVLWPGPVDEARRLAEPELRSSSAFESVRLRLSEASGETRGDGLRGKPAPIARRAEAAAPATRPEEAVDDSKSTESAGANSAASGDLLAEARLMADAQRSLRDGAWSEALKTAEAHRRRFPDGMLIEERWGVMALAQCALGRSALGLELSHRIRARNPSSPLLERIEDRCR